MNVETSPRLPRGIVTLAIGASKYIDQAISLARSIRVHDPEIPLAVITDARSIRLRRVFNIVHNLDPTLGNPYRQKLCIDRYSTFAKTLFVDSDCLAFRSVSPLFDHLDTDSFCLPTMLVSTGVWYRDVAGWLGQLNASFLPRHNSGCFCFAATKEASIFFETALQYYDRLSEFGIPKTHSNMSDEPAIAMALLACGIRCPELDSVVQFSPLCGALPDDYTVLRGEFKCIRTDGVAVQPYLLHCLAGECQHPRYRREVLKLHLRERYNLPICLCEAVVNACFRVRYGWRHRIKYFFEVARRPFSSIDSN